MVERRKLKDGLEMGMSVMFHRCCLRNSANNSAYVLDEDGAKAVLELASWDIELVIKVVKSPIPFGLLIVLDSPYMEGKLYAPCS